MSTYETPRPERVTLSDEERDTLACVATGHEPDLCDCHDGYRDNGDRFCEYAQETFAAVERILAAREQALREEPVIDAAHIERQRTWSRATFGPDTRTAGVLAHIRKELDEIAAAPHDVTEWVDVIILAIDGAWRAGHEPQAIIDALIAKQARNEARTWPDWRTAPEGQPIEHVRGETR